MKRYADAEEQATRANELGFPLQGLTRKLNRLRASANNSRFGDEQPYVTSTVEFLPPRIPNSPILSFPALFKVPSGAHPNVPSLLDVRYTSAIDQRSCCPRPCVEGAESGTRLGRFAASV